LSEKKEGKAGPEEMLKKRKKKKKRAQAEGGLAKERRGYCRHPALRKSYKTRTRRKEGGKTTGKVGGVVS